MVDDMLALLTVRDRIDVLPDRRPIVPEVVRAAVLLVLGLAAMEAVAARTVGQSAQRSEAARRSRHEAGATFVLTSCDLGVVLGSGPWRCLRESAADVRAAAARRLPW